MLVVNENDNNEPIGINTINNVYVHIGRKLKHGIKLLDGPHNVASKTYLAIAPIITKDNKTIGNVYLTQSELDQYNDTGGYVGGCGKMTSMNSKLSEMFRENPTLINHIYCSFCNKHLPVAEFVWKDTDITVGK